MSKKKTTKKKRRKSSKKWARVDGREWDELRPIKIETGILPNAEGSSYIEMGRNKIIAGVFGPREMHPKRLSCIGSCSNCSGIRINSLLSVFIR